MRRGASRALLDLLTRHRHLTLDMALREISERYSGQVFGTLWTIGHPLVLVATYVLMFRFVFKAAALAGANSPRDYTVYMLSGLIPWLACIDALNKSTLAIVGNTSLVKQIVFPLEVLPAKGVLATAISQTILLILLLLYSVGTTLDGLRTYALLPALVAVQCIAMLGVSYILSAVAVYFRDTKDLVQIFGQVGVYFIPAFYLPEAVPAQLRWAVYINPFSHLVWCYQDVLYFGYFAHPWSWLITLLATAIVFWGGFRIFTVLKPTFGNVL